MRAGDELICQRCCAVEVTQRFLDAPDVNTHVASSLVFEEEIARQGLHIPVEINADNLSRTVHERASGVSTYGVCRCHKVQWSVEIEFSFGKHPAFRQPVGRLVAMVGCMLVQACEAGEIGNRLAVLTITSHDPIGEPQSKRSIGRLIESGLGKARSGDLGALLALDGFHFIIVDFPNRAGVRVNVAREDDERV